MKKLLVSINYLFAILIILSYLSAWISPEDFWYISFLGLIYPVLFFINGGFVLFWLLNKPAYALISFLTLAIGFRQVVNFYALPFQKSAPAPEVSIKIASYNGGNLVAFTKKYKKPDLHVPGRYFKSLGADIYCLQEFNKNQLEVILKDLDSSYQYTLTAPLSIISRYPLERTGHLTLPGSKTPFALWADLRLPDLGSMRVYSIYMPSNRVSSDADQLVKDGDLKAQNTWRKMGRMILKYRDAATRRLLAYRQLEQELFGLQIPYVLAGDFNDVPQSYLYHQITRHHRDSFITHRGLATTYGGVIPFLRIDYLFAAPPLSPLSYKRDKVFFSDHYPIISTFALSNP